MIPPSLPVTLQVDASEDAIGGVLLQQDQPICFTSHTLSNTEKQYAQIEKECLAIVTCMNKWHQYLYGKQHSTVHTDHQPLESIFKKPISKAPRRLQRMMLKLLDYQFKVTYKKGKELHVADTLSRAALEDSFESQQSDVFRMELVEMDLKPSNVTAETLKRIRTETSKDTVLSILNSATMTGWPDDRKSVPEEIRGFWSYREEITADNGVLLKLDQVIVPSSLRAEMLRKIHQAHQGYDSSIRRARECLFWPGMQSDIRETCLSCGICSQYHAERPTEPMLSHEIPSRPWSKISVDLFALDGKQYFVMIDHYSDYFELEALRNVTASTVISVISDNGPQFDCHEFSRFARDYGFALVKSSPYHSRGNGKAESAVKIAKNILKKSREEDPYIALLAYRNTPQQGHVNSPAQRLMSRRLRDLIPMATSKLQPQLPVPSVVTQNIAEGKQKAKAHYDKRASKQLSEFAIGERVFVKPSPKNRSKPWIHGEVVNKPAPRSCNVSTPLGLVRRNHAQIRKASSNPAHGYSELVSIDTDVTSDTSEQVDDPSNSNSGGAERVEQPECMNPEHHASPEIVLRRSSRNRKLLSRVKDYVMNIS